MGRGVARLNSPSCFLTWGCGWVNCRVEDCSASRGLSRRHTVPVRRSVGADGGRLGRQLRAAAFFILYSYASGERLWQVIGRGPSKTITYPCPCRSLDERC